MIVSEQIKSIIVDERSRMLSAIQTATLNNESTIDISSKLLVLDMIYNIVDNQNRTNFVDVCKQILTSVSTLINSYERQSLVRCKSVISSLIIQRDYLIYLKDDRYKDIDIVEKSEEIPEKFIVCSDPKYGKFYVIFTEKMDIIKSFDSEMAARLCANKLNQIVE